MGREGERATGDVYVRSKYTDEVIIMAVLRGENSRRRSAFNLRFARL
jgi:hypothetical protein